MPTEWYVLFFLESANNNAWLYVDFTCKFNDCISREVSFVNKSTKELVRDKCISSKSIS